MWIAIALLLVLWVIGMLTSIAHGGLLNILLVVAGALLVYQLVRGRGPR